MLDHGAATLGTAGLVSFYKFSDRSTFQVDYASLSGTWIMEPERANLEEFVEASRYFDKEVSVPLEKPHVVREILRLYHSEKRYGPELPVPLHSLKGTTSFSVEMWFAFREFGAGNFSLLGLSGRAWDQGFAIAGVMTGGTVTLSCLLDTNLSSPMEDDGCYTDTSLCGKVNNAQSWHHVSCSRRDFLEHKEETGENGTVEVVEVEKSVGKIVMDGVEISSPTELKYKATMEELFSPGNFIIGRKEDSEGFNGYIRELRIWTKALDQDEINELLHTQLNPHSHSDLLAYWPLTNGNPYDFSEATARSANTFAAANSNHYGNSASEWVNAAQIPGLTLCSSEQLYLSASSACIPSFKHLAVHIDSAAADCADDDCKVDSGKKRAEQGDVTLAVWVFHTAPLSKNAVFIAVEDVAELWYAKENTVSYMKGRQGEVEVPGESDSAGKAKLSYAAPLGEWVFYALVAETTTEQMHFFYSDEHKELRIPNPSSDTPLTTTFVIGKNVHGYIKEARIWTKSLLQHPTSDSTLVTNLMREKHSYSLP